ncbi:MAG: UbiA family prenyltransferase, partial [Ktedonobacteraceae bacterium]
DRLHPQKRLRPLASGRVSATASYILVGILLAGASATALLVSPRVLQMLGLYFATMMVYSLWAKRTPIVDVLLLAGGYALRVLTGSFAAAFVPQQWLMAFCVFLFFSLALIKRYAELLASSRRTGGQGYVLGYWPQDAPVMLALGSAAGYLAVLVLALDTAAGLATHAAGSHAAAWVVCALLFFWVSHLWLMAHRERIEGDPVVYAIKNRGSLIPLILIALAGLSGL